MENKFRELLTHKSLGHSYDIDEIPDYRDKSTYIHTIEIAAVEQLKFENDQLKKLMSGYQHNHITRDIKEKGKCPACDAHHDKSEIQQLKSKLKMSTENKLPECPYYVAHPQAVWFNEHWRPVIEQLKAENISKDIKITIQHDKITALKSKLAKAKEALNISLNYLHWREDDLIGDDCIGDGRLTANYKNKVSKIEKAILELGEG